LLSTRPFSLPIVLPGEELTGAGPPALERALRLAERGDHVHRGLVFVSAALAEHAIRAAVAPGARALALSGLGVAEAWAAGSADEASVRKARSDVFTASVAVEKQTLEAIRRSFDAAQRPARAPHTALDAHADSVVLRYVGLAASHAVGAVLLVLDGVEDPARLVPVAQQVAGAIAYQAVGLGPARSSKLRAAAWRQAEWESQRAAAGHDTRALAVQLFHEFLGASWKDHGDVRRVALFELVEWALEAPR
jgi:hypothetical protein